MARVLICDWCKEKYKELNHSIWLDGSLTGVQDTHDGMFEICDSCKIEIKERLISEEIAKKKTTSKENKAATPSVPLSICKHDMELTGDNGDILKCTKCGMQERVS